LTKVSLPVLHARRRPKKSLRRLVTISQPARGKVAVAPAEPLCQVAARPGP
jgi:hypothetical protein